MNRSRFLILASIPCFLIACAASEPKARQLSRPGKKEALPTAGPLPPPAPESLGGKRRRQRRAQRERASFTTQSSTKGTLEALESISLTANAYSSASPRFIRESILNGRYVRPENVRIPEFLNHYTFRYPAAKKGTVAIYPELRLLGPDNYSLMVAARSEDRARSEMLPLNFTFLIDNSGSMAGPAIDLVREFMRQFTTVLRKGDRFSVVLCNSVVSVLVENFVYNKDQITDLREKILKALKPVAGTDLHQGLEAAYELAEKHYSDDVLNRVVVLSDGASYATDSALRLINKHANKSEHQGIKLVGVGFCEKYDDSFMYAIGNAGQGSYFGINDKPDIEESFNRKFAARFDVAAKDVRLHISSSGTWNVNQFHGAHIMNKEERINPQHLPPNNQMVYHIVLSRNEMRLDQKLIFKVNFRDPLTHKLKSTVVEQSLRELLREPRSHVAKADAILAYAEMVKKIVLASNPEDRHNNSVYDKYLRDFQNATFGVFDSELLDISRLMRRYLGVIESLHILPIEREDDRYAIGILPKYYKSIKSVKHSEDSNVRHICGKKFLLRSTGPIAREKKHFLTLNTSIVNKIPWDATTPTQAHPLLDFMGWQKLPKRLRKAVRNRSQLIVTLEAPQWAKSFSFDFKFLSLEYPYHVNKGHNDTFYAILEAPSVNNGAKTNIAFDAQGNVVSVDSVNFEGDYHPLSNEGTGFNSGGSSSWLRNCWPIKGGEQFKLTFSLHDEGSGSNHSTVILDNFLFHRFESVGSTDALN
ncbi:MAG: VWA domain-containing protein [Planctomycetota bacterium]|nr:VWA domain-containing protein [Planctomycetota bacterium]